MTASVTDVSISPQVDTVIEIATKECAQSSAGTTTTVQIPKLTITWENVNFNVKVRNPATKQLEEKKILQDVTGEAEPGELLVLMGPSGAGKSTLLDCISARNRECTGSILVNGQKWSKAMARHSCYVMQDDLFYANLTVLEHLTFQAELRMGRVWSKSQREEHVRSIISELGLTKVTNTPIGDALVKGLSGGQRKRLSFATELLTNPSLLFVDEPTSGLDSFMAETVMLLMRDLARSGRTVIATIHQPSSELFVIFDKLYLLVDGCTVFNGKASESIAHFAKHGYQCPPFMNPSDYFMKQLVVMDDQPEAKDRVHKLVAAWKEHAAALVASDQIDAQAQVMQSHQQPNVSDAAAVAAAANAMIDKEGDVEYAPGVAVQIGVLCKRNALRLTRDVIGFKARIGSTLFITVMIGLIFLRLKTNQKGVQDFTGAIFFIAVNQFFSSANPEFISVPLEIPLVLREHHGGLYSVLTWYVAKNASELPCQLFFPIIFLLPCYFMVGFGDADAEVFFTFYLVIALLASCATGLGYLVSCLAKRVDVAPVLGILFILPFLLFGGLFLNSDSTPAYFIWLQQISPIKYAFHALMRAFWSHVPSIACDGAARCVTVTGADVLATHSVASGKLWRDCLVLAALNAAFRLLGGFFLWRRAARHSREAASL